MLVASQGITATNHIYLITYYRHLKAYLHIPFCIRLVHLFLIVIFPFLEGIIRATR
jgi:hypothetical protein